MTQTVYKLKMYKCTLPQWWAWKYSRLNLKSKTVKQSCSNITLLYIVVWKKKLSIEAKTAVSSFHIANMGKSNESGFRPLVCTYRPNLARRTSWGCWDEWDDTGFEIQTLEVFGWARYLLVTKAPHNTEFYEWMGKKHFCFFQTAETWKRTPNSSVQGSGANHYPRARPVIWGGGVREGRTTLSPPLPPCDLKAENLPQQHLLESTILHQFSAKDEKNSRGHALKPPPP